MAKLEHTFCPVIAACENDHPLQTPWAFWYDKKQRYDPNRVATANDANEFKGQLHKIGAFNTVESFWKLYCHLKRPSALDYNVNLYLFRDVIPPAGATASEVTPVHIPMWEAYPRGGCWILKLRKRKDSETSVLGKMWQELVLSAIGELFDEPDVVGVSVCIRRNEDLLSVWNADNRNEEIRFRIGEKLKQILDLEPATIIEYKHHAESMQDRSTFRNAKAYVFAASETTPASTTATATETTSVTEATA